MHSPVRRQLTRVLVALGLVSVLALPAAAPVGAADPVVLRVGTVQDLDAMNPYLTEYYVGWEVFGLNYQGLVNFGIDAQPIGGFAESWTQDGNTWTFKINPNLKWSDGTPATSADALWTLQTLLDQQTGSRGYAGVGYLDPYLTYAAVTGVTAPDAQTLVVTTEYPNTQILTSYLPILPKHIWEKRDINTDANNVPVVGTGPYQAVEWKTGEYVRFVRNPNYLGGPKSYQDETFIQFFKDEAAMVEALKTGDIDYARNVTSDQFESLKSQPNVTVGESAVAAEANAFTHLAFNTYSKPIEGGGASTSAVRDPAFRDALGYAIDKPALVEKVLGGHGAVGTTIIPPAMSGGLWHLDPSNPRTFDLTVAKQKLEAAGYKLEGGKLLDKESKPITLKMVVPSSSTTYTQSAEFISAWWKELGIGVNIQALDQDAVSALEKPPEADPPGKASFDVVIWNWAGDVDPNSLLKIAATESIASGTSDTFFSNPRYDELFALQAKENDPAVRKTQIDEMEQILYDQAPYHVLFYDGALSAWRTDRFGGWPLSPEVGGLPFFAYGTAGYDYLSAPGAAVASPSAEASSPASSASPGASQAAVATPAPSASPDGSATSGNSNTLLLIGGLALIIVAVIVVVGLTRRRSAAGEEE